MRELQEIYVPVKQGQDGEYCPPFSYISLVYI